MSRLPSYPNSEPRAATLVGEFPAYDDQESIRTLEVPVVPAGYATEEVLLDDILELTPLAPVVSTVLPPPVAPARRTTTMRTTRVAPLPPKSMGPWIAGGVAVGILVSLGVAVVVRVVDARTPYPRTHVTVVQATGRAASPPPPVTTTTNATLTANTAANANTNTNTNTNTTTNTTATKAAAGTATATKAAPATATPAPPANVPSVALDTLPIVPTTRGTLQFSAKAHGHRVYVDGVVLGESDGPIEVRCGKHAIRVGSHGEAQDVDVPCGGDVLVK